MNDSRVIEPAAGRPGDRVGEGSGPKLLRVIARLNIGGPARQAILLHGELRSLGFETVLVHGEVGPGEGSLEHLLGERGLDSLKLPDLGARIRPSGDLRGFLGLLRIIFAVRPDIVHTHTAKAGTLGRLAALIFNATRRRRSRCLVVHTFHGNVLHGYFGPAGSLAARCVERVLATATDCIVTISPRQRSEIVDRFRIAPAERVFVVELGLELDPFFRIGPVAPAFRAELGFAADSILFGSIGRLVPIKDLPTLLGALALARESAPGIGLVIAGDGSERETLERLAASQGLSGVVRFLGWRHDLDRLYAGLDAVVLSSRNEGTPVTLIEAMASGRPVVATAVGGVPDIVADGETGLLVPPGDPRRLAEQMVRLSRSPEERGRLGAAGRAAAAGFRQGHLLDKLTVLYRDGLMKRRGRSTSLAGRAAAAGGPR